MDDLEKRIKVEKHFKPLFELLIDLGFEKRKLAKITTLAFFFKHHDKELGLGISYRKYDVDTNYLQILIKVASNVVIDMDKSRFNLPLYRNALFDWNSVDISLIETEFKTEIRKRKIKKFLNRKY